MEDELNNYTPGPGCAVICVVVFIIFMAALLGGHL